MANFRRFVSATRGWIFFWAHAVRARRLSRSSKRLWFREEEALLAQGKCRAKNPGAIQTRKINNKPNHQNKTEPAPRMHPGDRWKGETPPWPSARSRTPHRNRTIQSIFLPSCQRSHPIQMPASPCKRTRPVLTNCNTAAKKTTRMSLSANGAFCTEPAMAATPASSTLRVSWWTRNVCWHVCPSSRGRTSHIAAVHL